MSTTTDRELLELAAKVAGWTGWRSKHGYWNLKNPQDESFTACNYWLPFDPHTGEKLPDPTFADALVDCGWCPLDDDGDAFRLAVRLGFLVDANGMYARVCFPYEEPLAYEAMSDDRFAATRRAIVRAAAAIAKSQEGSGT